MVFILSSAPAGDFCLPYFVTLLADKPQVWTSSNRSTTAVRFFCRSEDNHYRDTVVIALAGLFLDHHSVMRAPFLSLKLPVKIMMKSTIAQMTVMNNPTTVQVNTN